MSERGPGNNPDASYAEFFNEQRRIEHAAKDRDLQYAVRYLREVMQAPRSQAKNELLEKALDRLDIAILAAMLANNLHRNHRSRLLEEAQAYLAGTNRNFDTK